MDNSPETVGEAIASEITDAIETANANAEERADIADAIIDGALETERARQVRSLEEDVAECLNNQAALSEAMMGMALQLEQQAGALSTLQALLPSLPSQAAPPSAQEDGPRESPEAEAVVIVAPEAETVDAPAEPPKPERKRKRWI